MPKWGYYLVQNYKFFISLQVYCWYIGYCEQKETKKILFIRLSSPRMKKDIKKD